MTETALPNGALRGAPTVDVRGLKCPLPVLKTEKALASLPPGGTLTVLATDPVAKIDIPLLCRKGGHQCTLGTVGEALQFSIVKAG